MYKFFFLFFIIISTLQSKPNILLIMVDDMGYSDLGSYGSEIKTPVIDKLAANGLRYTQFYNTGRCWPTRSSIMTGYYAQQIGRDKMPGIKKRGNRPSWAKLLSVYLQKAGYRAYHSGKWHIDGKVTQNGFNHSFHLKDQHRFFNPTVLYEDDKKLPPVKRSEGFYGTVDVTNYALKYLKNHQTSHQTKPFFLYLAYAAPHFPLHALPEDLEKVGDRYKVGWDVIRQQRWKRIQELGITKGVLPEVERKLGPPYHFPDALKKLGDGEVNRPLPWADLTAKQKQFQADKMKIHAAMMERVDLEIDRVLTQLKSMNAFEDTIIFFLSDNGASAEIMVRGDDHDPNASPGSAASHLCLGPGWSTAANTPFRKHKTWVHEGGTCTPLIVHYPKGIKAKGELRHSPGHIIDFAPTISELADLNIKPLVKFPGKSLIPTFTKDDKSDRMIWWSHENHNALRQGDWKLVKTSKSDWQLYNMANDRTESKDLAKEHPEKVQELSKLWQKQVDMFKKQLKKK